LKGAGRERRAGPDRADLAAGGKSDPDHSLGAAADSILGTMITRSTCQRNLGMRLLREYPPDIEPDVDDETDPEFKLPPPAGSDDAGEA
jgi:hypothetical protein